MIHAVNILIATTATALGSAMVWLASPPASPAVSIPLAPSHQALFLQSSEGESHPRSQSPHRAAQNHGGAQDPGPASAQPPAAGTRNRRDLAPIDRPGQERSRPQQRPQGDAAPPATERPIDALSPHQIERAIDILCQLDRERCEKLQDRRCEDPVEFDEQFARHGWRLLALSRLQQSNPDLFNLKVQELRLDSQIRTTAEIYRQAQAQGGREAAALEMQLKDLLRTQMELRLQVRGQQLIVLEQHVVAARDQLAEDARSFAEGGEQMIARRLEILKQRPTRPDDSEQIESTTDEESTSAPDTEPVFAAPK